ncbi:hypothetical protein ALGA_1627 [Labilibaculum antarcticum]|uniref:Uncharacterized protein n=2 Tax=Labilibaculum antarcticum TaxID=1717717 RepID=A0A1Y1CJ29_9BACT|nr:hypothetical protein ALGA_1627 [Labilibaculum antarcticum]
MIIEAPEMILELRATVDSNGRMEYQFSNYFANPTDLEALAKHLPEGACLILLEDGSLSVEAEEPSIGFPEGFSDSNYSRTGEETDLNVDPSILANIAIGSGMVSGLGQSYEYGDHIVKYGQRVNGKVRSAKVLTRVSQMNATKMATGLKVVGRGITVLSVATAGYQFANSDMSGNDYARLAGSAVITGTAFIPFVGPLISIGLGVADSYGVFDDVYNYFD